MNRQPQKHECTPVFNSPIGRPEFRCPECGELSSPGDAMLCMESHARAFDYSMNLCPFCGERFYDQDTDGKACESHLNVCTRYLACLLNPKVAAVWDYGDGG